MIPKQVRRAMRTEIFQKFERKKSVVTGKRYHPIKVKGVVERGKSNLNIFSAQKYSF